MRCNTYTCPLAAPATAVTPLWPAVDRQLWLKPGPDKKPESPHSTYEALRDAPGGSMHTLWCLWAALRGLSGLVHTHDRFATGDLNTAHTNSCACPKTFLETSDLLHFLHICKS